MTQTHGEKLAYGRGYNAGSRWPDHRPPFPPDNLVADLMRCALQLRDIVDGELAKLEEDDPWRVLFDESLEELDESMVAIGVYLRSESMPSELSKPE